MTFTVVATVRRTLVELLEVHRGVQLNPESPNITAFPSEFDIFRVSTCDILGTFVSRTHLRTCKKIIRPGKFLVPARNHWGSGSSDCCARQLWRSQSRPARFPTPGPWASPSLSESLGCWVKLDLPFSCFSSFSSCEFPGKFCIRIGPSFHLWKFDPLPIAMDEAGAEITAFGQRTCILVTELSDHGV